MKNSIFLSFLTLSAIASSIFLSNVPFAQAQGRPAAGQRGFWCDASLDIPATVYQNSDGGSEPWIRWASDYFSGSGWTPLRRCQEVSARLETYRQAKQLKYITAGKMNGENVICTASIINGRCENLIFTLKQDVNVVRTLNNLLAWREGQASTPSLYESGEIPYIDVSGRLGTDSKISTPSPVINKPTNVQPVKPSSTPSNGMREL